jgi:hypothetical protein
MVGQPSVKIILTAKFQRHFYQLADPILNLFVSCPKALAPVGVSHGESDTSFRPYTLSSEQVSINHKLTVTAGVELVNLLPGILITVG